MTVLTEQARLRGDFAACTAYMRQCGPVVYAMPRMLLPPERRPYCDAVQAFTIHADKLIDDPRVPAADRRRRYGDYTRAVLALVEDGDPEPLSALRSPEDAIGRHLARAFAHFMRVWDVPPASVRQLLENMAGDAEATEYPAFADLERYIRGTGVPYIHWINALLGRRAHTSEEAREKAADAIFGLSLTDNLQDLAEDLESGRLCLPVEDLRAFGLHRDDLVRAVRQRRMTGPMRDLVRFEADRAHRYLAQADGWWRTADPAARELPRQYVRLTLYNLRLVVGTEHDLFAPRWRARATWGTRAVAGFTVGYSRAGLRRLARLPDRRPRPAAN